ncbi:MAG: hypothetical protein ABI164_03320 [Acidobacteriaceae bacterium]
MTILRVLAAMCVIGFGCGAVQAQSPTTNPQPQNVLKIKTKSNLKNDRTSAPQTGTVTPAPAPVDAAKIKSHSNQANNRQAQPRAGSSGRK